MEPVYRKMLKYRDAPGTLIIQKYPGDPLGLYDAESEFFSEGKRADLLLSREEEMQLLTALLERQVLRNEQEGQ